MKFVRLLSYFTMFCCICLAGEVGAAVTVDVRPSPDGATQYVSVSNVSNAAVIDFKINYDSSVLSDPVVTDGRLVVEAAAIRELKLLKPGVLRVVYVSLTGFKKSGALATVTFTKTGTLRARDPKIESDVFSADASQLATRTIVHTDQMLTPGAGENSNNQDLSAGDSSKSGKMGDKGAERRSAGTSQASVQQSAPDGKVLNGEVPGEGQAGETAAQQTELSVETGTVSSTANASVAQAGGDGKKTESSIAESQTVASVIDNIKAYKGARTLKGFAGLFNVSKTGAAGVEQIPGIFVADGKKTLKVFVTIPEEGGVPSFSLKGANLKGIRSVSEKKLELEIMPQKGKLDIRLTVVTQKLTVDVPLIAVPPVAASITGQSGPILEKLLSKADAQNKTLIYDLNLDGKQDYLDDYILVAHWLIRQDLEKTPAAKTAVPR